MENTNGNAPADPEEEEEEAEAEAEAAQDVKDTCVQKEDGSTAEPKDQDKDKKEDS